MLIRQSTPITSPPACSSLKKPEAPCAEMDHRHAGGADALDQRARVGGGEAHVIVRTQGAYPAIEHLDGAGPGGHRRCAKGARISRTSPISRRHRISSLYISSWCALPREAPPSIDVAGHGEGSAHEADHRHFPGQRAPRAGWLLRHSPAHRCWWWRANRRCRW